MFIPAGKSLGLCLRKQTFTLGALAGQLARTAHGLGFLAGLALRGLLEVVTTLHFAEETFALHLLLERLQRLIDVVIADNDLNYLKLSIGFPAGFRGIGSETLQTPKRPQTLPLGIRKARPTGDFSSPSRYSMTDRRRSDTI